MLCITEGEKAPLSNTEHYGEKNDQIRSFLFRS
jgi:hypothetical protein